MLNYVCLFMSWSIENSWTLALTTHLCRYRYQTFVHIWPWPLTSEFGRGQHQYTLLRCCIIVYMDVGKSNYQSQLKTPIFGLLWPGNNSNNNASISIVSCPQLHSDSSNKCVFSLPAKVCNETDAERRCGMCGRDLGKEIWMDGFRHRTGWRQVVFAGWPLFLESHGI